MDQPHKTAGKAFYILLCAILGLLLFIVIQRAAALIYYLMLNTNYQSYSLGLSYTQLSWLNFLTLLAAVFFGLWYGIWLGLHWYEMVYESGGGHGLFHAFKGHWLHNEGITKTVKAPQQFSASPKPAVRESLKLTDITPQRRNEDNWDLDDLLKPELPAPAKPLTRPKAAAKPATKRKAPAK